MSGLSAISLVAAVAAWTVVVLRARPSWRAPADLARRALWVTALALAVAWTLKIDRVFAGLDRVSGIANLAEVVSDVAGLATGAAILTVLVAQRDEPAAVRARLHRLWAGLAALAAAMVAVFAVVGFPVETRQFTVAYATRPGYWAYEVPYLAAVTIIFTGLAVWAAQYVRATRSRLLTAGMATTALGGVLGLGYVAVRVVFTLAAIAGTDWSGWYEPVSALSVAAASLFALGGAFIPALGPRLTRRRARRDCRDLLPLWRSLRAADLMQVLLDPDGPEGGRDPGFTARRLVVEIDDGLLQLRPWLTRPISWAADSPDPDRAAAAAAGDIRAALDRRADGAAPARGAARTGPAGTSSTGETDWLRRVSRAYAADRRRRPEDELVRAA